MPRAAIYARISRDREGTEVGVENQQTACRELASARGYTVVATFIDNDRGASTRSKKSRPEFAAMLAAAERGDFDVIVAYSNSRLTRRPVEFERLIALHEQHGVKFATKVSGEDDLSTADGRMIARLKASIDAGEAERIGERVQFAKAAALAKGQDIGGRRPFGFDEDRSTIRETEAALIRSGARSILAGETLYSVAKAWTASGVREQPWRSSGVRAVLTRPRNTGRLVVKGVDYGKGDRPGILSDAEFDDLLSVLASNTVPGRGRKAETSTAVTLVKCGVCGAGVELTAEKDGTRVLRCSKRGGGVRHPTARAAIVEEQLVGIALMRILREGKAGDRDAVDTTGLRVALATAKAKRDRARADVEAYEDEGDRDYARQRVATLTADVNAARAALDEAMTADIAGRARYLVQRAVRQWSEGVTFVNAQSVLPEFREMWNVWPIADRRELLRGLALDLMPATETHPKYRLRVDGEIVPRAVPAALSEPF